MIILDTNVLSELMKPIPDLAVRDWLTALGQTPLAVTAVTVAEIEFGLRRLPDGRRKAELQARFELFVEALDVLPLDEPAARACGGLRASREAMGLSAHAADMMIAGIARVANAALATRNLRDFEGLSIDLTDPWRSRPPPAPSSAAG